MAKRRQQYAIVFFVDATQVTEAIGAFRSYQAAERAMDRVLKITRDEALDELHPVPSIVELHTVASGIERIKDLYEL